MNILVISLVSILVILCLKSLLTIAAQKYLQDFFNDPTGGIVPLDSKPQSKKQ